MVTQFRFKPIINKIQKRAHSPYDLQEPLKRNTPGTQKWKLLLN